MAKVKPHTFFKSKKEPQVGKKEVNVFPSIPRIITEKIRSFFSSKRRLGIVLLFIFLFIFLGMAIKQAYRHYQQKQQVFLERQKVEAEVSYWKKVIIDRPGYRDGYFQLALLSYQLGSTTDAKMYLDKTMQLDPNFSEGKKLAVLLDNK